MASRQEQVYRIPPCLPGGVGFSDSRDSQPTGILLTPALGAVFMSLSTVIVAINAQLLRRVPL